MHTAVKGPRPFSVGVERFIWNKWTVAASNFTGFVP